MVEKVICPAICMMNCLLPAGAFACTDVYAGREASTDGTILIACSNDTQRNDPPRVIR